MVNPWIDRSPATRKRASQGSKSMLSIGGMILQNGPFFDIGGDDLARLIIF